MTKIIKFPSKQKRSKPMPKQRVFYIGFRYVGPMFCQDVQSLYLKRNGLINDTRTWSLIRYGKYDENDYKEYSIELDKCQENDLPDMLDEFDIGNQVNFDELRDMGWKGVVDYEAKVENLFKNKNNK
jgi:hypothetical protein